MPATHRFPANPANALNGQENTGIFLKVVGLGGIGGSADVWRARIPPKVAPAPAKASNRAEPPALSLPILSGGLVPLDTPFADGRRYRLAGATELRTRLDLYLEDPAGPWIRRHGALLRNGVDGAQHC